MALGDPQGRYLEVNTTHARMLGRDDPAEMIGLSFENFVHPDDVADTYASIERLREKGTDHGERGYINKDGATVDALFGPLLCAMWTGNRRCSFRRWRTSPNASGPRRRSAR
jgi:PAS domain S-box-containing protein